MLFAAIKRLALKMQVLASWEVRGLAAPPGGFHSTAGYVLSLPQSSPLPRTPHPGPKYHWNYTPIHTHLHCFSYRKKKMKIFLSHFYLPQQENEGQFESQKAISSESWGLGHCLCTVCSSIAMTLAHSLLTWTGRTRRTRTPKPLPSTGDRGNRCEACCGDMLHN
jgi:hypothetical protein